MRQWNEEIAPHNDKYISFYFYQPNVKIGDEDTCWLS